MCFHNRAQLWQLLPLMAQQEQQQHSRSLERLIVFPKCTFQILSRILAALFALAGFVAGGVAGACTVSGASENGMIRRASLGALAGTVFALRLLVHSGLICDSDLVLATSTSPIPALDDFLQDFASGVFMEDVMLPTELFVDSRSYDGFDAPSDSIIGGIAQEALDGLSCYTVAQLNAATEPSMCCSICLEELKEGDIARALPLCNHSFHSKCIDQWLLKHAICPICRHCIS